VSASGKTSLFASPSKESTVFGAAEPGAVFPVDARVAGFFRVALDEGQHAWIDESSTRPGGQGVARFARSVIRAPSISLSGDAVRIVKGKSVRVEGFASHPDGIRDVIAFVGDKKISYVAHPGREPYARLDFSFDLPLADGENEIAIVARHDGDVWTTEPLFVRRTPD